jgi:hypothetical protein
MSETETLPSEEGKLQAELALPEDVTSYVEDRQEQEAADRPPRG